MTTIILSLTSADILFPIDDNGNALRPEVEILTKRVAAYMGRACTLNDAQIITKEDDPKVKYEGETYHKVASFTMKFEDGHTAPITFITYA